MLIDRTFESDDAPTRKPRTGMFGRYTDGSYDLGTSYVVGDRATDILLARNLGAKGILLAPAAEGRRMLREAGAEEACVLITDSWAEIAEYIRRGERRVVVTRETRETQITVRIDLDGRGFGTCGAAPGDGISTGLRFLDHMLTQIAHHGGVSLTVEAHGDLDIDEHHTMEDVAIVLGEAIDRALGSKAGIGRYGFALPMDDCRALVLLDFGGRIDFEWDAEFRRERVGDVPTEMFRHFFHSLCCAASSLSRHISCMPMQMPSTGCVRVGMSASSPRSRSLAIADEASPTPGRSTLSACRSTAASDVTVNSAPMRRRALATERRLPVGGGENPLKIPHVGWDTVGRLRSPLFDGLGEDTYLYYVHSFAAQACDATIAQTDYGGIFSAALGRGNFFGTQFHPEKSGRAGERSSTARLRGSDALAPSRSTMCSRRMPASSKRCAAFSGSR